LRSPDADAGGAAGEVCDCEVAPSEATAVQVDAPGCPWSPSSPCSPSTESPPPEPRHVQLTCLHRVQLLRALLFIPCLSHRQSAVRARGVRVWMKGMSGLVSTLSQPLSSSQVLEIFPSLPQHSFPSLPLTSISPSSPPIRTEQGRILFFVSRLFFQEGSASGGFEGG